MPTPKTITTRFLIISDTHGTPPQTQLNSPYRLPFPKADVLLHCGDISNFGNASEYEPVLSALKAADAELKIIIAGNHDLTLDEDYMKREIGWDTDDQTMVEKAKEMWMGKDARANGIRYLEEGVHEFTLNSGAKFKVYASPYTPELPDWAFHYPCTEDRYNPSPPPALTRQLRKRKPLQAKNPIPSYPAIDIILTHGPPEGILDRCHNEGSVGCEHLRRALERARPKLHCFGHIHESRGAEIWNWSKATAKGRKIKTGIAGKLHQNANAYVDARTLESGIETLCVNAAIMDGNHEPRNPPWIVDLELNTEVVAAVTGDKPSPTRESSTNSEVNEDSVYSLEDEARRRRRSKKEEVIENPEVTEILSYP